MAGSTSRLGRLFKTSFSALFTPAENPRELEPNPEQQQRRLLSNVRDAIRSLAATREQLERQHEAVELSAHYIEDEARCAVSAHRDDLARIALQRHRSAMLEADQLRGQITGLLREEGRLAMVEQRISGEIEAARARQQLAEARHSAARAQVAVGEALSGIGAVAGTSEIAQRIERDAEDLESRASAIGELIAAGVLGSGLVGEPSDEAGSDEIERQLAALKMELAVRSTAVRGA